MAYGVPIISSGSKGSGLRLKGGDDGSVLLCFEYVRAIGGEQRTGERHRQGHYGNGQGDGGKEGKQ